MSKQEWQLLLTAKLDEETVVLVRSQYNVCQYRRSDLKNRTKNSLKYNEYRSYSHMKFKLLCQIMIQAQLPLCHKTLMNTIKKKAIQQHGYLHPYSKQYLITFIVVYLNLKLNNR